MADFERAPVTTPRLSVLERSDDRDQANATLVVFDLPNARLQVVQNAVELPSRGAFGGDIVGELFRLVCIAGIEGCAEQRGAQPGPA
jgi:hypothetical protein